jgi:signal transduction histidine kinase
VTRRPGLAARLLVTQLLVLAVGGLTLALVALLVGPPLFRAHIHRALGTAEPGVLGHLEDAFASAGGITIGVGGAVAFATATAVTAFMARRLSRPIRALDTAASRLSAGDYTARMPATSIAPELDILTGAFNTMAAALEATEATRRRLLADVAHELRTPLATLDAYFEGLADGVRSPTADTWDVLAAQTARLRRLADDIALVSRAEEGQLGLHTEPVAPNEIVRAAVAAARPGYGKQGVRLAAHLAPVLPDVAADPERLAQVLAGLLSNALRHTPPGGTVTVATEAARQSLRIVIADTGEGITPEHLPHIFERFYRVDTARDRARGGSGIGLTIAGALITAHGGTLTAASDGPGCGAQFTITLPGTAGGE